MDFLLDNTSPNPTELWFMQFKCRNYKLIDSVLYKGERPLHHRSSAFPSQKGIAFSTTST